MTTTKTLKLSGNMRVIQCDPLTGEAQVDVAALQDENARLRDALAAIVKTDQVNSCKGTKIARAALAATEVKP